MKTAELIAKLPDNAFQVVMNFGPEDGSYNVGNIAALIGSDPEDAIVEAGASPGGLHSASELRRELLTYDPDGNVQMYISYGSGFAYLDVGDVVVNEDQEAVYMNAGDFRTGG
jgi:hypothetical protein